MSALYVKRGFLIRILAICILVFLLCTFVYANSERIRRLCFGVQGGVTLEGRPVGGFFKNEVEAMISELGAIVAQQPQNATVDKETGEILPEIWGIDIDPEATLAAVMSASRGTDVRLITRKVEPKWNKEDLASLTGVLGTFQTWMQGSSNRRYNIRLACSYLTNTVVFPGQEFSFNKLAAPYTEEHGYKSAPIIDDYGQMSPGTGGGICQVSSTLYNAVYEADLLITERHKHTLRIYYIEMGRDATVANDKDFKFVNNREYPIIVKLEAGGPALITSIYGKEEDRNEEA